VLEKLILMEADNSEIIQTLSEKINELIILYEDLKLKNEQLTEEKISLNEKLNASKDELKELNNKYEHLKVAKELSLMKGSDAPKENIDKIVREIDKCIALLNK
jgi:chromosome segregation ATPase